MPRSGMVGRAAAQAGEASQPEGIEEMKTALFGTLVFWALVAFMFVYFLGHHF